MREEEPVRGGAGLREAYELLRSRRATAGRHVDALFVDFGMARWIRATADLGVPGLSTRTPPPAGDGTGPRRSAGLPAGVVRELVPVLVGLVLLPEKGGEG